MTALQMNDLSAKPLETICKPEKWFFSEQNVTQDNTYKAWTASPKTTISICGERYPEKKQDSTVTTDAKRDAVRRAPVRGALKNWFRFLKEASPQEISKETLEQYKTWLFEQRNEKGWYLKPSCIVRYLQALITFLKQMRKEGFFPKNPLQPFYTGAILEEMETRYTERRKGWVQEKKERYSNEELLRAFREHGRKGEYSKAYKQDRERVTEFLGEYAKRKNKSLFILMESELEELQRSWFDIELQHSVRVSEVILMEWSCCLRLFYRWAFEEGYHENFVLEHWSRSHIKTFLQTERERREQEVKTKSRHYNLKEILRAYWKYLKESYENYENWKALNEHFRHFLRFLIGKGESVYTVTEESVEAYKQVLFHYEYQPGRFYSAYFQAERLRCVKRFFDWFTVKGYSVQHPLKKFGVDRYRKQIEGECDKRESQRKKPQEIPEAFCRIYESIERQESGQGLAKGTLRIHRRGWRVFFHYLEKIAVEKIEVVDEEVLNDYQRYLYESRNSKGGALSLHTRIRYLIAVKRLFAYLARFKMLPRDPSACIDLPKNPRGLPTSGMNDREVRQFLEVKDPKSWKDLRDRAMLETLYSTGIRSNELRNLRVQDIDFETGLLRVNVPKGGIDYQRVIPIGRTAMSWIQKYRQEARKPWTPEEDILFLSQYGKGMSNWLILNIVKTHLFKSGIRKKVVTHSFRVSCATEMLKNKADIKFVQQQLGHSSISSTERYLRLVPSDLKKVHSKTHPREKWNKTENVLQSLERESPDSE